ncbi:MAG: hypothetical protein NTX86_01010 [Candidatus Dependentiae bacterium]|nr:hypothetical protein [Candidatus Dependentiae bacterium]
MMHRQHRIFFMSLIVCAGSNLFGMQSWVQQSISRAADGSIKSTTYIQFLNNHECLVCGALYNNTSFTLQCRKQRWLAESGSYIIDPIPTTNFYALRRMYGLQIQALALEGVEDLPYDVESHESIELDEYFVVKCKKNK